MRSFRVTFTLEGDEYYWSVSPAEDDIAVGEFIEDGGHEMFQSAVFDAAQAMIKIMMRRAFDTTATSWMDHPVFSDPTEGFDLGDLGKDGND